MPLTVSRNAALLVIDVQVGFDELGVSNSPAAEANIAALLECWRRTSRPILHIQHVSTSSDSPFYPGKSGVQIKAFARPIDAEPLISKKVNSAFIGTDLEARLREAGIHQLVICGLTTDHCVSTTTRMAGNLGFEVILVGDATATFAKTGPDGRHWSAEELHSSALASLHDEFATVVNTADLLAPGVV